MEYFDLRFSTGGEQVLGSREMPGAQWFPGAEISYAEHMFRGKDDDALAIQHASELRELGSWTWGELRAQTAPDRGRAAGARASTPGDRVVAYMPNIPETVAAFLACASIGAVWSSAAPEFGARSVIDRFAQVEPKVLLAIDGYRYGGKDYDRLQTVAAIAAEIPALTRTVRFGYLDGTGWEDGFLGPEDAELTFAPLPFDHPLWVLYSSGTTGLPKPIVHGQGGILLEQIKKMHLHLDAQAGDRVFWFTTTGWMMWNFLVGVLLTDASIVLYRRQPRLSRPRRPVGPGRGGRHHHLRDQRRVHRLVHEGRASSRRRGRDLSALTAVGSTGSPLSPEGFRWVYDQLGSGHLAVLDLGRDRHVHRVRGRRPDAPGVPGRAAGAAAWARRSRPGIRTASRWWTRSASW